MSDVFSSILGTLNSGNSALGSVLGAGKGAFSIFDMISQFQQQQKIKSAEDQMAYYSKHPEALSNLAASYTKPLSQGLVSSVGNVVQAQAGERGLSQAPGIFQQNLAQALAPYQQQNQQMGIQLALQQMGLPAEMIQALLRSQGTNNGLAKLLASLNMPNSTSAFPNMSPGAISGQFGGPTSVPTIPTTDLGWTIPDSSGGDVSSLLAGSSVGQGG